MGEVPQIFYVASGRRMTTVTEQERGRDMKCTVMTPCKACAGTGFADRVHRSPFESGNCDHCNGRAWVPATPAPYYHGFFRWAWLRLTGYRDQYGRKAALLPPWG